MLPEFSEKVAKAEDRYFSLPSDQRTSFLEQLRSSDPEVATELERRLGQSSEARRSTPAPTLDFEPDLASTAAPTVDLEPTSESRHLSEFPDQAGRYAIEELIARGGMGAVLRARDPDIERTLAVKVMLPRAATDPSARIRFLEEARITGQLQHPGIPPVHEIGQFENGSPFFAMKLIEGETLSKLLKSRESPSSELPKFLGIFGQICQTVAYAHSRGIIHRDLKPSNIMVGAFAEVQVMDWGLAKFLSALAQETVPEGNETGIVDLSRLRDAEGLSETGDVMGTPAYMAPEQARGDIRDLDSRTDVFGLGAILCEILTGVPAFRGDSTREIVTKAAKGHLDDALARLDRCGAAPELIDLAKRCLAPDRQARPGDASFVADAIEQYEQQVAQRLRKAELEKAAAQAKAKEEAQRLRAEKVKRRVTVALAFVGLLLVVAVGGIAWFRWDAQIKEQKGRQLELEANAQRAKVRLLNEQEKSKLRRVALSIRQALDEAGRIRSRLQTKLRQPGGLRRMSQDPQGWAATIQMAQSAVKRAKTLWERGGGQLDLALRDELEKLQRDLEGDEKDRLMVGSLIRIREESLTIRHGLLNRRALFRQYSEAFANFGLDVHKGDVKTLAQKIRRSVIGKQMIAAMDYWALQAILAKDREQPVSRLGEILAVADTDPFRQQFQIQDGLGLLARIEQIAQKYIDSPNEMETLTPAKLFIIGMGLQDAEKKAKWFRAASFLRPDDLVVGFGLADALSRTNNYVAGEECYARVLAAQPENLRAWCGRGNCLYRLNKFHQSMRAYKKAIQIDSNYALVWNNMADTLVGQGKRREALKAYKKALELDPEFAAAWTSLGLTYHELGQSDQALVLHKRALKIQPDDPIAWNNLGLAYMGLGNRREAIEAYKKALEFRPRYQLPWSNLAIVYRAQKNFEEAINASKKALELAPDDVPTWNDLGLALQSQRKPEAARKAYERALELDPKYSPAWNNLGNVLRTQKKFDEAIAAQKKAVQFDSNNSVFWSNLGISLLAGNRFDEAITAHKKALELDPGSGTSWLNLGIALHNHQKFKQAIEALNKSVKLDPNRSLAWLMLGRSQSKLGQLDKAIQSFHQGLKIAPKNKDIWIKLGLALRNQKKVDQAVKAFRRALQIDPNYGYAWINLGDTFALQQKWDEAAGALRKALKTLRNDAYVLRSLGVALAQQKQFQEATEAFRASLKFEPKNAGAWANLGKTLFRQKKYADSIEAYTNALKFPTRFTPVIQMGLGEALFEAGQFPKALRTFRRLAQLVPERHPLGASAQSYVRACENFLALEKKLPAVLAKEEKLSSREYSFLILLCVRYKKRYGDATKLYIALFEQDPQIAKDLKYQERYNAACAAALASAGLGIHADKIDAKARTQLRQQSRTWLLADLKAYRDRLQKNRMLASAVVDRLQHWQTDPDLASVRDKNALAKLPKEEAQLWQEVWTDVRTLENTARKNFNETKTKGTLKGNEITHKHKLNAGRTYIIQMRSDHFDTELRLEDSAGMQLKVNDDRSKTDRNSQIEFRPKRRDVYHMVAGSVRNREWGAYEIIIREFQSK